MKDLHNNTTDVVILAAVVVAATGNSGDIDLAGCNACEFVINTGVDAGTGLGASHNLVFSLTEADDDGTGSAGDYTAVASADILGTVPTIDSTDEDATVYRFGYTGACRFVKLTWTETGTVSMPVGITMTKGHLRDSPAL